MEKKYRVAGVVVLYNPKIEQTLNNIQSYINSVDRLFVIDNSLANHSQLFMTISKINYINLGVNLGIAHALNIALSEANIEKYEWLLTMDQDSSFDPGGSDMLISAIRKYECKYPNVAVISSNHTSRNATRNDNENKIITSGSLVKISSANKVNGWDEKLFLDGVDYDFILRIREIGLTAVVNNEVCLNHQIGNPSDFNILGVRVRTYIHDPFRTYYCFRNGLYLVSQHGISSPKFALFMIKSFLIYLIKVVVVPNRQEHMKMILKALIDYRRGKFGVIDGI